MIITDYRLSKLQIMVCRLLKSTYFTQKQKNVEMQNENAKGLQYPASRGTKMLPDIDTFPYIRMLYCTFDSLEIEQELLGRQ